MDEHTKEAFFDELTKVAGPFDWFKGLFKPGPEKQNDRLVKRHFKAKDADRWDRFGKYTASKDFVEALNRSDRADKKLVMHAQSLHDLKHGTPAGRIDGGSGSRYEIKELPGGRLGCTCNDWKYVGSVTPGHECKHIKAFKTSRQTAVGRGLSSAGGMLKMGYHRGRR